MGDPKTKTELADFQLLRIIEAAKNQKMNLQVKSERENSGISVSGGLDKESIAYTSERPENEQKEGEEGAKKAENAPSTALDCLRSVAEIGAQIEEKCQRALMFYLSNRVVHQVIVRLIQQSESSESYEQFIIGISALVEQHKSNKAISLTAIIKEVSGKNESLSIRFLTDHVAPIVEKVGIIRRQSENKFRWASYEELSAMVTKATTIKKPANVHVHKGSESHVHKEENVQMDAQEQNGLVQTGLVGKLNDWINALNENALSARKQKRIEQAKFDPWKRVLSDGTIENIVYEPTEEEKELARKKQVLEEKMKVQSDILQLESTEYLTTFAKKEAEHHLKIQRESQKAQQQIVALTLEKSKARNESFQANKDAVFNLAKLGAIFGVAILLIVMTQLANNLIGVTDSDFPIETAETFPW